MTKGTLERLDEYFRTCPGDRGCGATDPEINAASAALGVPFPPDYREFLRRYAPAMLGPYPLYGVRNAPSDWMRGANATVVTRSQRHRSERWGTARWVVVAEDLGGNPWGIGEDSRVWVADADAGVVDVEAEDFEGFLHFLLDEIEDLYQG